MRGIAAARLGLALLAHADARAVRLWTPQQLTDTSTLVVVARPGATRTIDTSRADLVDLETDFQVVQAVKGAPDLKKIVVHHFRPASVMAVVPDGPRFVTFPDESFTLGTMYRLYLVRDNDGRYLFVTGPMDPELSIVPIPEG